MRQERKFRANGSIGNLLAGFLHSTGLKGVLGEVRRLGETTLCGRAFRAILRPVWCSELTLKGRVSDQSYSFERFKA